MTSVKKGQKNVIKDMCQIALSHRRPKLCLPYSVAMTISLQDDEVLESLHYVFKKVLKLKLKL